MQETNHFWCVKILKRNLILGVDFAQKNAAGVHWTKHNSFVLTIDGDQSCRNRMRNTKIHQFHLKSTRPSYHQEAVQLVDVDVNTDSTDKVQIIPDEYCLA